MYFEDDLEFSESTKKVIVGIANFALGALLSSINLATLSVLPDCIPHLPSHSLTFFALQLFSNIAAVISISIPVPYMLAINQPYFLNPILHKAPGVVYTLTSITAGALQFWSGLHRNLTVVFPGYTQFIFSNLIVTVTSLMSLIYGVSSVVDIDQEDWGVMIFDVGRLSWKRTDFEFSFYQSAISYTAIVALLFYALSICDLIYKLIYEPLDPESDEPSCWERLFRVVMFLVTDLFYAALMLLPHFGESEWAGIAYDFIRIYGLAFWPTISVILHTPIVLKALHIRVKFVMIACVSNGTETSSRVIASSSRMRVAV